MEVKWIGKPNKEESELGRSLNIEETLLYQPDIPLFELEALFPVATSLPLEIFLRPSPFISSSTQVFLLRF